MLARLCGCDRPQVFDGAETCAKCGHEVRQPVQASTWRLALAISEVALGRRPVGDRR